MASLRRILNQPHMCTSMCDIAPAGRQLPTLPRKMEVSIPVVFQAQDVVATIELKPGQSVASKRAAKKMRQLLAPALRGIDMSSVTFTCEDGSPLSHMAAADFTEQHGRICARGSGYSGYRLRRRQQLQREFKALGAGVAELSQRYATLKPLLSTLPCRPRVYTTAWRG